MIYSLMWTAPQSERLQSHVAKTRRATTKKNIRPSSMVGWPIK